MEYHSAIQENGTTPFAATDGPRDYHILSDASQTEKDKYMILLKCGIFKNDVNELIYKTEIDSQT